MTMAMYAGAPFRIDPHTVRGSVSIRTNVINTIGGRVVQVYGARWSDLTVEGHFGRGTDPRNPWADQLRFLDQMTAIGNAQFDNAPPQQFLWPEKNWNFQVYLKAYQDPEGSMSITYKPDIVNPKWRLTLFVVVDNGGLLTRAADDFISRFSKGLAWQQSTYNGPLTDPMTSGGLYNLPGATPATPAPGQFIINTPVTGFPGDSSSSTNPSTNPSQNPATPGASPF